MFSVAYTRVSTDEQETQNQVLEIKSAGFKPTLIVEEKAVSGKVRATERPAFSELLRTFERVSDGQPKQLIVTKIDRIGRDAEDVLSTVRCLQELGVEVLVLQLGKVDLASPMGKMILTTLAAMAEWERSVIIERTLAGLARAKAEGKRLGRPEALSAEQRETAKAELAGGASINGLAKRFGVARGTIRSLKAA